MTRKPRASYSALRRSMALRAEMSPTPAARARAPRLCGSSATNSNASITHGSSAGEGGLMRPEALILRGQSSPDAAEDRTNLRQRECRSAVEPGAWFRRAANGLGIEFRRADEARPLRRRLATVRCDIGRAFMSSSRIRTLGRLTLVTPTWVRRTFATPWPRSFVTWAMLALGSIVASSAVSTAPLRRARVGSRCGHRGGVGARHAVATRWRWQ